MKNQFFPLLLSILLSTTLTSQDKDYSLAKVGIKKDNIYVFIGCTPVQEYNTIDTWEVYWNRDGKLEEKIEEAVTRARKKYNNVDGIIFSRELKAVSLLSLSERKLQVAALKAGIKFNTRMVGLYNMVKYHYWIIPNKKPR